MAAVTYYVALAWSLSRHAMLRKWEVARSSSTYKELLTDVSQHFWINLLINC
jgi:hypothetical protein